MEQYVYGIYEWTKLRMFYIFLRSRGWKSQAVAMEFALWTYRGLLWYFLFSLFCMSEFSWILALLMSEENQWISKKLKNFFSVAIFLLL